MSVDRVAANEMVRRTGQTGVPVIADAQEAIVGYDVPRLQRLAARHARPPGLGLRVADATNGGAHVGGVRPGSPAERAGVQVGDVVLEMSGHAVASAADLERVAAQRHAEQPTSLVVQRDGTPLTLIVPPQQ